MQLGITMFATDESMPVAEMAVAAEERGFASLYIPEHTHIPTSRLTPPPTGDPELPEEYRRTLDPLVALAAAAAVTSRIRLGTGICVVAQREPLVTAKAIATLDRQSGGRFVFGIGFGWNREEIEHHGVDFSRRRDVAREHVLAMQALWHDDVAEFHGEFVDFSPSWSWPKPVQRPHPPIYVGGGTGPKLLGAVAEYADGWMPIGGAGVRAALDDLRRACDAVGRDPATVGIIPFGTVPEPAKLEYYATLGISEVVLRVPSAPEAAALPVLDQYTEYL
ncbi:MAG: LLM class F420-dependent oxidoreductase [Acidimicrobiia bacterium]